MPRRWWRTMRGAAVPRDLALRVYTTRLIGSDPALVLHGGGNTSVKLTLPDLLGSPTREVLCVKGSGWGHGHHRASQPARGAARAGSSNCAGGRRVSDRDMVAHPARQSHRPDGAEPVGRRRLLHAFLPHAFVDHSHATAVLSLTDQPDGEAICAEVYDGRMGSCPSQVGLRPREKGRPKCSSATTQRRRADPDQARHVHVRRKGARATSAWSRWSRSPKRLRAAQRKPSRRGAAAGHRSGQRGRADLRGAGRLKLAGGEGAQRRPCWNSASTQRSSTIVNGEECRAIPKPASSRPIMSSASRTGR